MTLNPLPTPYELQTIARTNRANRDVLFKRPTLADKKLQAASEGNGTANLLCLGLATYLRYNADRPNQWNLQDYFKRSPGNRLQVKDRAWLWKKEPDLTRVDYEYRFLNMKLSLTAKRNTLNAIRWNVFLDTLRGNLTAIGFRVVDDPEKTLRFEAP